ncbi:MAG TPA: peroxiredoxin [Acidimicrobiales bacterium]|nr:peroxiredoxin [Acidimicrobiales bacterium]
MTLRLGDYAPDFTADSTRGKIAFHDFLGGSWGVLFSHPKDFAPVCTTELGEVARLIGEFERRSTKVVGISVDSVASHCDWFRDIEEATGCKVNFPVIGDPDRIVANLYGMVHPFAPDPLSVRSVVVIDPDKRVELLMNYPIGTGRNLGEILRALDSLQLTARHAVMTPANWQPGDDVIISPNVSDEEAGVQFPQGFRTVTDYLRFTPQPGI